MFDKHKYKITTLLGILILITSSCAGTNSQSQDQISTAVAQTVQAQESLTKVANITIPTLLPTQASAVTSNPDITNTPAPVSGNPGCTVSASLINEIPPDGAILKPGEAFWKTWTIKNTGTCTWDSTYKLIYWSGDLLDGLTAYPLPEVFTPEAQKDIAIYLRAPANEGSFAGYWKIQTPWGESFGVGQYSEPIYVEVAVSNEKRPAYQITSVEFSLVRDPESGCPTNVYYTLNAAISTNGPLDVKYNFTASGSLFTSPAVITFDSAQTKTVSYTFSINKQSNKPTDYWFQFFISDPKGWDFKKIYVNYNC